MIYLESMLRFAHMEATDNFQQKKEELILFSKLLTIKVNNSIKASITTSVGIDLYGMIFVANPEHLKHPSL